MKLILLPALLLLLASCTQYRYDVTYEKCNWQTGSLVYSDIVDPLFVQQKWYTHRQLLAWWQRLNWICSYNYTRNEIK